MVENVNNKYYIKLEAVTPLSVGAGNEEEWVKCADYVIHEGKVYLLDLQRVAEQGMNLDQLSLLLVNQDHEGIIRLLGNHLTDVSRRIFALPCTTDNNIKAFERSQMHDLPVVAGSSLKGALRSILFKHLRDHETTNEEVFGKMKDGSDFMRFIKVGDFEMPETKLFNSKIFNLQLVEGIWNGGWKHAKNNTSDRFRPSGFNTLYECVSPSVSGVGSIIMSLEQFSKVIQKGTPMSHAAKKQHLLEGGLRTLFSVVNDYTREYLTKERAFFLKYHADRTDQIIDCIDDLLSSFPSDNSSCLLKMSAGVGFHAITGDWQYADFSDTGFHVDKEGIKGKKKYKSRKIVETADGLKLMGFVRLSEISEMEHNATLNSILETFRAGMKSILAQKAEAQAKQLAAEQERLAREQDYSRLISESLEAEKNGDYIGATDKANEAILLFPDRQEPKEIILRNEKNKKEQQAEMKQKEAERIINELPPFADDIAGVKDFTMMKGRCKKRKADFCSPEGKVIVERWLETYFASLSPRDKKNLQKPKKWLETFSDCYDEATIAQWIETFAH